MPGPAVEVFWQGETCAESTCFERPIEGGRFHSKNELGTAGFVLTFTAYYRKKDFHDRVKT
jgi:hypothetical protein